MFMYLASALKVVPYILFPPSENWQYFSFLQIALLQFHFHYQMQTSYFDNSEVAFLWLDDMDKMPYAEWWYLMWMSKCFHDQ